MFGSTNGPIKHLIEMVSHVQNRRKRITAFLSVNFLPIIPYAAVSRHGITSLARIPAARISHSPGTPSALTIGVMVFSVRS